MFDNNFREVDCIRMVRRRMADFIRSPKLLASGVALQIFPANTYPALMELHKSGWNDWKRVFQWPGTQHSDAVRDYFGEEVGFFFHWFNFFNRYLVVAGIMGGLVYIIELLTTDDICPELSPVSESGSESSILIWPEGNYAQSYSRLWFTVFMCL